MGFNGIETYYVLPLDDYVKRFVDSNEVLTVIDLNDLTMEAVYASDVLKVMAQPDCRVLNASMERGSTKSLKPLCIYSDYIFSSNQTKSAEYHDFAIQVLDSYFEVSIYFKKLNRYLRFSAIEYKNIIKINDCQIKLKYSPNYIALAVIYRSKDMYTLEVYYNLQEKTIIIINLRSNLVTVIYANGQESTYLYSSKDYFLKFQK